MSETKQGPHMVLTRCVREGCGATFYIMASAAKVKCPTCRTEWPRTKGGKVLMARGGAK